MRFILRSDLENGFTRIVFSFAANIIYCKTDPNSSYDDQRTQVHAHQWLNPFPPRSGRSKAANTRTSVGKLTHCFLSLQNSSRGGSQSTSRWRNILSFPLKRILHSGIQSVTAAALLAVPLALLLGLQHVLLDGAGAAGAQSRASALFPQPVQHVEPQHEEEPWEEGAEPGVSHSSFQHNSAFSVSMLA